MRFTRMGTHAPLNVVATWKCIFATPTGINVYEHRYKEDYVTLHLDYRAPDSLVWALVITLQHLTTRTFTGVSVPALLIDTLNPILTLFFPDDEREIDIPAVEDKTTHGA